MTILRRFQAVDVDTPSKLIQNSTLYATVFLLYLALFIFVGFFLRVHIGHWTLLSAIASYIAILAFSLLIRKASRQQWLTFGICTVVCLVVVCSLGLLFGHTYDTSYDGQDYQQSGIIGLADGWNPIYQKNPPIQPPSPVDLPIDNGYGKAVWSIDASVYAFTHNINMAASLNLVVGLLAVSFLYYTLRSLGVSRRLTFAIIIPTIITPLFVEQLFTFKEDAVSYSFLVIGITSLVLFTTKKQYTLYSLCLLTSLIFLAGIKDSNVFIFLPLLCVTILLTVTRKWYLFPHLKMVLALGFVTGCIILYNPYFTNVVRYRAIDYPFNEKRFSDLLLYGNVPLNLRHDNRFELLYYGIFSRAVAGEASSPIDNAHLKIPLTFSAAELQTEASPNAKLVGGYGILFSGTILIAIIAAIYAGLTLKHRREKLTYTWLILLATVAIGASLVDPNPNYARYNSGLFLLPAIGVLVIALTPARKQALGKILIATLLILTLTSTFLNITAAGAEADQAFTVANKQLHMLKSSDAVYLAHAGVFYSNYTELSSHGVKIIVSPTPVHCKNPLLLVDSRGSTFLCRLGG